jgi:hypothetical protein
LPNLWIPRTNQFFHIDELPHLGSGKLDLRRVHEIAREKSAESGETATGSIPAKSED